MWDITYCANAHRCVLGETCERGPSNYPPDDRDVSMAMFDDCYAKNNAKNKKTCLQDGGDLLA